MGGVATEQLPSRVGLAHGHRVGVEDAFQTGDMKNVSDAIANAAEFDLDLYLPQFAFETHEATQSDAVDRDDLAEIDRDPLGGRRIAHMFATVSDQIDDLSHLGRPLEESTGDRTPAVRERHRVGDLDRFVTASVDVESSTKRVESLKEHR